MNLINKLTQKIKYTQPKVEIIDLKGEDIITSSGEIAEIEFTEKTEKEEEKELTFFEKYPDGLPLEILELIDFKHFGAMLKQEQLLPPSYDRRPTDVAVYVGKKGLPVLVLKFNSKTSHSYRKLMMIGYVVSESINNPIGYTTNADMSSVWEEFAQRVMYLWERGYRFELLDQKRRGEIGESLMQEDKDYIQSVEEIAKWNKKRKNKIWIKTF